MIVPFVPFFFYEVESFLKDVDGTTEYREHDEDFDPMEYQCQKAVGSEVKVGHWLLVKENFRAEDFGFTKWADEEKDLIGQYKMRCAFHPVILLDRYMTPAVRLAEKKKRDILNVRVGPDRVVRAPSPIRAVPELSAFNNIQIV